MFCVHCGSKVPDGGNFCVNCGQRVTAAPAVPPAGPKVGDAGQIIATPVSRRAVGKCSWCGAAVEPGQLSCPQCGATLKMPEVATRSGWAKLPGRKDMAKLQFGNSVCQIEGKYVPVADLKLAAEDSVYFTHHVLLWKDPQVQVSAMSMRGGWKRMFGGLPLVMTQAQGPGHIAFSQDSPGELIPIPLQHGQAIDVREHLFLAATGNVAYDWFQTNIWFQTRNGNETETHYPVGWAMDQFSPTGAPGLLLLHAAGNVFVRELAAGQVILIKPTALVFKDPTVQMDLQYETPSGGFGVWASGRTGYLWLRLSGPGRVAIQSVFDRVEGEDGYISGYSNNPMMGGGGSLLGGLAVGGLLMDIAGSLFDSDN